ncbi:MAG: TIGR02266 family protein, partial [Pseudomonadota bacterium]
LAEKGLVLLPVAIRDRTVCMIAGHPLQKVSPELRNTLAELSNQASKALAALILQKRDDEGDEEKDLADQSESLLTQATIEQKGDVVRRERSGTTLPWPEAGFSEGIGEEKPAGLVDALERTAPQFVTEPEIYPEPRLVVEPGPEISIESGSTHPDVDEPIFLEPKSSRVVEAPVVEPKAKLVLVEPTEGVRGDSGLIVLEPKPVMGELDFKKAEPEEDEADISGEQRRECVRFPAKIEVSHNSEHNFFTGFMENMSTGGIFVATYGLMEIGERIEINFTVPGYEETVIALCEVRWVREYNPYSEDGIPGMGLKFLELDEKAKPAIEKFICRRDPIFYDD